MSVKSGTPIAPASTGSKPTSTIPIGVKNLKVAIPSNTKTVGAGAAMPAANTVVTKPQQAQQRVILPSGQTFKAIIPHQTPEVSHLLLRLFHVDFSFVFCSLVIDGILCFSHDGVDD
jgi:hypothetical protein